MKWRKKNRRKISISNLHMRDIFKTGTNAIYFYSREFAVCQSKVRFVFVQNIGLCVPFTNWIQPKQRCCAFHVHDHVVLCTCNAKTQKSSRSLARLKSAAQWRCIALACGASRASLIRCHAFCILRLLYLKVQNRNTGRLMQINRRRRQWRPVGTGECVGCCRRDIVLSCIHAACLQTICELNFMESESNVAATRHTVLLKFYLPTNAGVCVRAFFVFPPNRRTFENSTFLAANQLTNDYCFSPSSRCRYRFVHAHFVDAIVYWVKGNSISCCFIFSNIFFRTFSPFRSSIASIVSRTYVAAGDALFLCRACVYMHFQTQPISN